MTRRRISARERKVIFETHDGTCHICQTGIDDGREPWDVDHVIPLEMGGDDDGGNLQPAHAKCHRLKTKTDAGRIAKARRMRQRAMGIKRQPRNPMPGSLKSKWFKPLHGNAVRRDQ